MAILEKNFEDYQTLFSAEADSEEAYFIITALPGLTNKEDALDEIYRGTMRTTGRIKQHKKQ